MREKTTKINKTYFHRLDFESLFKEFIDSQRMFEYSFIDNLSYQTKNQSHRNIIRERIGWNNQNQIKVCHKSIKVHNQIQKFKNISWILFSLNLNINFDSRVPNANVHTKNQAQNKNNNNSLTTYIIAQEEISDFFIHKFTNPNNNAQMKNAIVNFHNENLLFFNK